MKKLLNHFLLAIIFLSLLTCKKKTSINATAFNYALNEPVANATIVLVERHQSNLGNTSCKEIASAITDSKGECEFNREKFRRVESYTYFLSVKEAYGLSQNYPCEGKASGFLEKGKSNRSVLDATGFDGHIRVQYNDLLNPSQQGDSLIIGISSAKYLIPGQSFPFGGGGVFSAFPSHGSNGFPFPAILLTNAVITTGGKKVVKIKKRKMGIITTSVDTVKVYPNETITVEVNW